MQTLLVLSIWSPDSGPYSDPHWCSTKGLLLYLARHCGGGLNSPSTPPPCQTHTHTHACTHTHTHTRAHARTHARTHNQYVQNVNTHAQLYIRDITFHLFCADYFSFICPPKAFIVGPRSHSTCCMFHLISESKSHQVSRPACQFLDVPAMLAQHLLKTPSSSLTH